MTNIGQIMLMAKEGNRDGLAELQQESLVDAIIEIHRLYRRECVSSNTFNDTVKEIMKMQLHFNDKADMGTFNIRSDMEQQLTETELERDNLKEELQQALERIDELEQKLAVIPKVGRPKKYDAEYRAKVRDYYNDGHTYRETAEHFKISSNTVGRFLNE